MFDRDTMIITYDRERGDPRGSRGKKVDHKAAGLGDCVDCGICVQVCPTGIDIRNGLQYECIGCAACIDGCDQVMDKMGYPRGLIRYSTENALKSHWSQQEIWRHMLRPRTLIYSAILGAIIIAVAGALVVRVPLKVDVIRDRGALVREVEDGQFENVYRLQVMNATEVTQRFRVEVEGLDGATVTSQPDFEVGPAEARWLPVSVQIPRDVARLLGSGVHPVKFEVESVDASGDKSEVEEKSTFVVPR
jgi:cytochrome c oxidase accessory protein FixG